MNNENSHLIRNDKAIDLMLAGNFTFTAKSLKTGNHYTYRILSSETRWRVYLLVSNNEDYRQIGTLWLKDLNLSFVIFKGLNETLPIMSFKRIIDIAYKRYNHPQLEIWHSGTCARCGRPLTDVESIRTGLGPICIEKIADYIKSLNLQ